MGGVFLVMAYNVCVHSGVSPSFPLEPRFNPHRRELLVEGALAFKTTNEGRGDKKAAKGAVIETSRVGEHEHFDLCRILTT